MAIDSAAAARPNAQSGTRTNASVVAVIVNYKLPSRTRDAVRALLATQSDAALTVFVLDNGAGDVPDASLRELAHDPRVHVEATADNIGYCAAVNRGLAFARARSGEFVLLLNNDVRVAEPFLARMVAVLRNDATVAAVSPTITRPDGVVWCQGARMRFGPNINVLLGQGGQPAPRTLGPQAVDYLPGACVLYRLAELTAIGDVDESYFMYMEDADLGARLRARGHKLLWLPWVRVEHDASASSGGGRSPMRKFMTACNAARFLRQHGTVKLWASFVLFDLLLWPLAVLFGTSPRAAWAKARGAWSGLFGRRVGVEDVTR
jgi:GT2 family glycosyltransferase